jgi:SmpA / OmlA family
MFIYEIFSLTQELLFPLAFLIGLFAAVVWLAKALSRPAGLRFTVRQLMVAVILLAFGLGAARWWVCYNFATVYAPGYDESQFRRVRIGMTSKEVESILGDPLRKDSTSAQRWGPYENWIYSEPPPHGTIGDNYWRRWVMFDDGKVVAIVDDYYED